MACPVPHTRRDQVWLALGFGLGAAVAAALFKKKAKQHPRAHVLMVKLQFDNVFQKADWKNMWSDMAETVYKSEPNCLSYQFCDGEDDTLVCIIYERYATRADLDGPHQVNLKAWQSRYAEYMAGLGEVKMEMMHFTESYVGYMSK
eukprot:gb/GFBE01011575.1/.p1 GENE.gb/GFBE01011575.1/~~gb/GFBE01011575.1/.p1  ORF type:complete len:146 (+),score=30.76 gb/GFBE01011575.1/:1-438(+)